MENLLVSKNINYYIDLSWFKEYKFKHIPLNSSGDFDLIPASDEFLKPNNVVVILDNMMFDCIGKTSHPFNSTEHRNDYILSNKELFFQNFNDFFEKFPKNTKFILYDNDAESVQPIISEFVVDWLETYPSTYFISSRYSKLHHERLIVNLIYLPIIFAFYIQEFYYYPMLEFSSVSNPKYDFITYLGHSAKTEKIKFRYDFLKQVFGESINKVRHSDLNIIDNDTFGNGRHGHMWNLVNSLTAKVQIIFENASPTTWYYGDFCTEKIMRCFLLPHPYILLLNRDVLEKIEQYGFQFPIKCSTIYEYKNEIQYVCENIDEWIEKNNTIFYNNQINFYNMISSTTLPHHSFLQNILK